MKLSRSDDHRQFCINGIFVATWSSYSAILDVRMSDLALCHGNHTNGVDNPWFFPHEIVRQSDKSQGMSQDWGPTKSFSRLTVEEFQVFFTDNFGGPHFWDISMSCDYNDYKVAKKNVFKLTGESNMTCLSCTVGPYCSHTVGNLPL